MATPTKAFYGVCVTITNAAQQLLPLLVAADASIGGILQNVQYMQIQNDDSNGANSVLIGDSLLSPTRYGVKLLVHEGQPQWKEALNIPLGAMYAMMGSGSSGQINVMIIT